ncbi:MAG: threonine-phosphate decarboxylase [Gammaproteobacteria bacterium]|nr:MAG: threonine-phosphate decarboxylase [Gammaproteobacteria bacterium]
MGLKHGGNVSAAAERFGIPVERWIDLSTGISPWNWPVPPVPEAVWRTLPDPGDGLELIAATFFGCAPEAVLAVPGSQYALQYMPANIPRGKVAMPQRGYAEHRAAWMQAGHRIIDYRDGASLQKLVDAAVVDHALVINPNNPTGELLGQQQLQDLHQQLHGKGGYLVVDEAFADTNPDHSLSPLCPVPGLIVYRSVGKFFGLAGLRLGFMLAPASLCHALESTMPPWQVSHPARWIGMGALADSQWQLEQRHRLDTAAERWLQTVRTIVPDLNFCGTSLFVSGTGEALYCQGLYQSMGRRGVLLRLFPDIGGQRTIRFGLPAPAVRAQVEHLLRESVGDCVCACG